MKIGTRVEVIHKKYRGKKGVIVSYGSFINGRYIESKDCCVMINDNNLLNFEYGLDLSKYIRIIE